MKSESIDKLATALNKFQGEVANILKTSENPYFKSKYAKLEDILNEYRPIWTKHGLSISQHPVTDEQGRIGVQTEVYHNSGEYRIFPPFYLTLTKNDPQGGGSAITYARRYSLAAVLGIQQEDDDGNTHAVSPTKAKAEQKQDHVIETKQRKIQEVLTKYSKDKLYGFNPDAVKQFIKDKLGEERISACRDLDVLNNAIETLELMKVNYKEETPARDINALRNDIIMLQDELAEKAIDGYQTQKHRAASINKHLGTITVNQCEDMDKLTAYEAHLQSKLEG